MPRGLTRRRAEVNTDTDDQDDEEERPTTRRRTADSDSGRSTARRRPTREVEDDDDDDEDAPPPRSGRRTTERKRGGREEESTPSRAAAGRGWDGYKKAKAKASKWNSEDKFAVDDKGEELIAFLDDAPFCTWNEHFIRELDGKKSWTCLDDDCPICARGDNPGYRAAFNVVVYDDKGNPSVKYWIATPGPLDEIEEHASNERYGPLNKEGNYFVVSKKKGKNNFFKYKVERITEDQVRNEFGFEPLTDEEFTELEEGSFEEKDVLVVSSRKELRDVVRSLDD